MLAEAIQTIMRKHHVTGAYERLKTLTRGASVSRKDLRDFIDALAIPHEPTKKCYCGSSPDAYIGRSGRIGA